MPLNITPTLALPEIKPRDQACRSGGSAELSRCRGRPELCSKLGCAGDASVSAASAPAPGPKATPLCRGDSAIDGVDPYCCPKPRALAMLHRQNKCGRTSYRLWWGQLTIEYIAQADGA